jgi:hypothetical protein
MSPEVLLDWQAWAIVELGLSKADFRRLTPAELNRCFDFWRLREKRWDARIGKICYTSAVSTGAKLPDGSPIPPNYFTPWYKKPRRKKRENVIQQLLDIVGPDKVRDLRK